MLQSLYRARTVKLYRWGERMISEDRRVPCRVEEKAVTCWNCAREGDDNLLLHTTGSSGTVLTLIQLIHYDRQQWKQHTPWKIQSNAMSATGSCICVELHNVAQLKVSSLPCQCTITTFEHNDITYRSEKYISYDCIGVSTRPNSHLANSERTR
jgi:hypothetical protein